MNKIWVTFCLLALFCAFVFLIAQKQDNSPQFVSSLLKELHAQDGVLAVSTIETGAWDKVCLVKGDDSEPTSHELMLQKMGSSNHASTIKEEAAYIYFEDEDANIGKVYSFSLPMKFQGADHYLELEEEGFVSCVSFNSANFRLKEHRGTFLVILSANL